VPLTFLESRSAFGKPSDEFALFQAHPFIE
jgi:hypothetical protein